MLWNSKNEHPPPRRRQLLRRALRERRSRPPRRKGHRAKKYVMLLNVQEESRRSGVADHGHSHQNAAREEGREGGEGEEGVSAPKIDGSFSENHYADSASVCREKSEMLERAFYEMII